MDSLLGQFTIPTLVALCVHNGEEGGEGVDPPIFAAEEENVYDGAELYERGGRKGQKNRCWRNPPLLPKRRLQYRF